MKKILFINGSNVIGGGELSLLSIAKSFKNCSVLSFDYGDFSELLKQEHIHSIVPSNTQKLLSIKKESGFFVLVSIGKYLFSSIIEVRKIIKNYDTVYCNSQKGIFLGLMSSLFLKKQYIVHVRDMLDNPKISLLHKIILKYLITIKKPIIITNSNATAVSLENIGIHNNIHVVYNGIVPPIIQNKKRDKFIVSMFSRISPWKGQEYFIEAAKQINNSEIEYWIIGDAMFGENEYKQKIINMVKDYGLEDKIKFIGYVNNPLSYMQNIDILILPSMEPEPFGRVVIEAMFLKKVVIATNMGGVPEIIDNANDGFLINSDNIVSEIKEKINMLYQNKNLYNKISENASIKVNNKFTEEKMLSQIHKIIGKY